MTEWWCCERRRCCRRPARPTIPIGRRPPADAAANAKEEEIWAFIEGPLRVEIFVDPEDVSTQWQRSFPHLDDEAFRAIILERMSRKEIIRLPHSIDTGRESAEAVAR